MKIHDEIDDWSAGALCGALTPEEQQNFERHLAECPRCRSLHEEDRKMNDTLNEAMAEARPDPNFERRIINGFRDKIAQGWFHPWRGLVWLMRFRVAQAAAALVILAAMVEGGSLLSGEGFPGGKAAGTGAHFSGIPSSNANGYVGSNFTINNLNFTGTDATVTNGPAVTISGNITNSGNNGSLALQDGSINTVHLNGASPSLAGLTFSAGSTMYNISSGAVLQFGNGTSGNDGTIVNSPAGTTSVLDSGIAGITFSTDPGNSQGGVGRITIGDNNGSGTFSRTITNGLGTTSINKVDVNGQSVTFGSSLASSYTGGLTVSGTGTLSGTGTIAGAVNNGALVYDRFGSSTYGGTISGVGAVSMIGTGMQALSGTNTYSGTTTINGGTLRVTNSNGLGYGGNSFGVAVAGGNPSGTFNGAFSDTRVISGTVALESLGRDHEDTRVTVDSGKVVHVWDSSPRKYLNREAVVVQNYAQNTVDAITGSGTQTRAGSGAGKPAAPGATPAPAIDTRKLIRNASLDFEVPSFEKALDTITAVAGEEQGYVFSQSSAKGANGKLQGQVIVKVMPANVDRFLLKLRLLGDMKNQTVSAQDVSKDYYDTEARIRNSEVTEARLIDMMKTRTGKVSDLLEVENEIAKVRGEIEQMQGQLKFYDALVQYATVTISLEEKDLNQAAAYLLTEQAQLYLFSKDVEKAFTDAKTDAADAKAQTLESHIERDEAGHVIATLHLLIPPENADATIVKLKEIGRIQHFNSQTQRIAKGDGSAPSDTAKVDHDKVELTMTIQQDAENPVQGTNISIQTDQVDEKTKQIKDEAADAGVEVKGAEFNRLRNGVEISALLLRMPIKNYSAFLERIKALGKVKEFTVARREDATVTDDAPAEIVLQIYSQAGIVAPDTGLWFTVRHTLGEGMGALMWSLRMIGVSLAFIAPWAVIAGLVWLFAGRRWLTRK